MKKEQESVKLLREIRDLLDSGDHIEETDEQRREDDKEKEKKNDWMVDAAAVDRICAIIVTIIYIVGTVALLALMGMHP